MRRARQDRGHWPLKGERRAAPEAARGAEWAVGGRFKVKWAHQLVPSWGNLVLGLWDREGSSQVPASHLGCGG